jgi:AcrR family transcriptional regulator
MPRAERRLQLLSVAQEIIEGDGIGALTMSALAERSGASKPVVYEHFENSEAVAVALLEDYYEGAIKFVTERVEHAESIDQYIGIVIDSLFEYNTKYRVNLRNITNGYSSSPLLNATYLDQRKRSADVFFGLLQQQGVPKNVSLVAARGLLEMMDGVVMEFAAKTSSSIARDTLKRMMIGAIHSLAAEPGPRPHTPSAILKYRAGRSKPRKAPPAP